MATFEESLEELRRRLHSLLLDRVEPKEQKGLEALLALVARQHQEVGARLEEESALREVESHLSGAESFEAIGALLVRVAIEHAAGERGFLLVQAGAGGAIHRVVSHGIGADERDKGPSNHVVRYVLAKNEPVVSSFMQGDARWAAKDGSTMQVHPREVIAVPIPGEGGAIGVLYVDRVTDLREARMTADHMRFLVRLAAPARQAIGKASLIESLRAKAAAAAAAAAKSAPGLEVEIASGLKYILELRGQAPEVVRRLLKAGLVKMADLERAVPISRRQNISITRTLLQEGAVDAEAYMRFVQDEMKIPYVNLSNYIVDQRVTATVPREVCERYLIMPLHRLEDAMTVAMVDPLDPFILETLSSTYGTAIRPMIATREEIERAIDVFYPRAGQGPRAAVAEPAGQSTFMEIVGHSNRVLAALRKKDTSDKVVETSMLELVNVVLESGVRLGASDVHVQPEESVLKIRYRIDGVLHTVLDLEHRYIEPFTSAIKILAKLDIAERRMPQDGKAIIDAIGRKVDLRVSTLPGAMGEKVVLRILDRAAISFDLDALGFESDVLEPIKQMIQRPNGLFLVTGPTGSGKTTTLYAALSVLNTPDANVITLEDPVEFTLEHVTQAQVHARIGFDFASGLRSILRQDPDVIMVGEIRDAETADISLRAALTGHLVFSTLHTNDAAGAITRLIDLGIDGFRLGETLLGVLAQRLVRLVCRDCKITQVPDKALAARLGLEGDDLKTPMAVGRGCGACNHTGYRGRAGIHELLRMTPELRRLVFNSKDPDQIRALGVSQGMRTLRSDGLAKARRGLTSLEEVAAATAGA